MPSTSTTNDENAIWLKKQLTSWKSKSTMRLHQHEKIVAKALSKAKYKHGSKCRSEVFNAVKSYRGLSPAFEKFIFDNGDEAQLLNLTGTIPVDYKGGRYNIPVNIWFLLDFPTSAPMAFVVPTKDMQLKISNHVDHTGKIFLTYLTLWRYPASSLLGFLQACREAFGELPPVFSKVVVATPPSTSSNSTPGSSSTSRQNSSNVEEGSLDQDDVALMSRAEALLKERFLEEFHKTKAELQTLHSTNKELLDGQEDIGTIDAELDAKLSQITACLEDLNVEKEDLEEASNAIDELDPQALDADKGILSTQEPIHAQIVNCYTEDAAIGDAIYHLGEGFRVGLFPSVDVYLKKVRNLSRQQFYLRAKMIKARENCGLE